VDEGHAAPILPSHDLAITAALFDRLGFECSDHDDYVIVERGGIELHFSSTPDVDPFTTAGWAFVRVHDVDAYHRRLVGLDVLPLLRPDDGAGEIESLRRRWAEERSIARLGILADMPWGVREFALFDPCNNLLRFGQSTG
jgi:hypothetical protein